MSHYSHDVAHRRDKRRLGQKPLPTLCVARSWPRHYFAYLKVRQAALQGMSASELEAYARELRSSLPSPGRPQPGGAADLFIRTDMAISGVTEALVKALLPDGALWTPR